MAIKLKKSSDTDELNVEKKEKIMDNKSNKWGMNLMKIIVAIVSIVIIYMFATHVVSNYDEMEKRTERYSYNYLSDSQLLQDMIGIGYGKYFDMVRDRDGIEQALSEMVNLQSIPENQMYDVQEEVIRNLEHWRDTIIDYSNNLQYYIADQQLQTTSYNLDRTLNALASEGLTQDEFKQLASDYQFVLEIYFDELGNPMIKNLLGTDVSIVKPHLTNQKLKIELYDVKPDSYEFEESEMEEKIQKSETISLNAPKNTTMIFAISNKLASGDQIYYNTGGSPWDYELFVISYVIFFASLIGILVILLPYRLLSQFKLLRCMTKIPFELLVGGLSFITLFLICSSTELIYLTQSQELVEFFIQYMPTLNSNVLTNAVNIGYWLLLFTVIYIDFYVLKHMVKVGIFTYIKENTITFKILKFIKRGAISIYKYATDVNLEDKNTKQILILLTVNFVLVSIMCSIWFFGIIVALIYSGVIFFLVTRYIKKIRGDYAKLAQVTHALSEGNVDVLVEEDLGCFNELRDEMKHIQAGFKKAVAQEVKSQRMKTDLIANVSHDLKTPLTSIITYVDLLKDPNLSDELRGEYVQTLDRKADRLKVLIEDLFEMSKASSGNVSLNLVEVDVVSLMKQTLLESEDKINEANLILRRQFPEEKVLLHLDSQRTYRVFENLILNMTKYAMPSTRAYIEIIDLKESVQITFRNMSAEEITFSPDEIVERFVRGDSARHTEGSGLGLAISKSFVELQGGQFEILVDGDLFKVVITFVKK